MTREEAIKIIRKMLACTDLTVRANLNADMISACNLAIKALEQEPIEKCTWIKYDYRTMCPKEHIDADSPYWRIPENRMETLKYCPYCGKEIEVEE